MAMESLVWLADVLEESRQRLQHLMPPTSLPTVDAFYTRTVHCLVQCKARPLCSLDRVIFLVSGRAHPSLPGGVVALCLNCAGQSQALLKGPLVHPGSCSHAACSACVLPWLCHRGADGCSAGSVGACAAYPHAPPAQRGKVRAMRESGVHSVVLLLHWGQTLRAGAGRADTRGV